MSTALAATHAPTDDPAKIDKLKGLIEKIRFCMMTTIGEDGALHSRPMSFLEWSENGALLFFTSAQSETLRQIKNQRMVDLAFCEPAQNVYVSLLGEAEVLNDPALTEKLFSPIMRNWFPDGPTDPKLRLLSVTPQNAEYWDGLSGLSLLLSLAKARLTDKPQKTGEHEYFEL